MNSRQYVQAMYRSESVIVAKARNDAVDRARECDAEWLMFIDADMVFEPQMVEMLLAHDKDIVGGLCVKRVEPYTPTVFWYSDEEERYIAGDHFALNSLTKCDATGTAFLLIRMSAFDKLEKPYFAFPPSGEGIMGEDLYFCTKARDAGFEIFVDTGVSVGHLGDYPFTYVDRINYLRLVEGSDEDQSATSDNEGGIRPNAGGGISALLRTPPGSGEIPSVAGEN